MMGMRVPPRVPESNPETLTAMVFQTMKINVPVRTTEGTRTIQERRIVSRTFFEGRSKPEEHLLENVNKRWEVRQHNDQ